MNTIAYKSKVAHTETVADRLLKSGGGNLTAFPTSERAHESIAPRKLPAPPGQRLRRESSARAAARAAETGFDAEANVAQAHASDVMNGSDRAQSLGWYQSLLNGEPAQAKATPRASGSEAVAQARASERMHGSAQSQRTARYQGMLSGGQPRAETAPVQRRNDTGLPDPLKAGVESLSGVSMDGVKVHYNSEKPAQMQALAYTQGSEIHVAPGQEQHVPHEAWHAAQQRQGRVQATSQMKGVALNDQASLETEADAMGARAASHGAQIAQQQPMPGAVHEPDVPDVRHVLHR